MVSSESATQMSKKSGGESMSNCVYYTGLGI